MDNNQLCGVNEDGAGTYTAEGISKIAEMLAQKSTLTSLR